MTSDVHQLSRGGSRVRGPGKCRVPHAVRGEPRQVGVARRPGKRIPEAVRVDSPRGAPAGEHRTVCGFPVRKRGDVLSHDCHHERGQTDCAN